MTTPSAITVMFLQSSTISHRLYLYTDWVESPDPLVPHVLAAEDLTAMDSWIQWRLLLW
uniref:Predicted protein n=1 Tax=Hordeum vulgare subsp. vulgare TaxID=112509 RepID=F2EGE4_HORVV|nr:predicted protein [Hordeum vulgare subsp. vulgare]